MEIIILIRMFWKWRESLKPFRQCKGIDLNCGYPKTNLRKNRHGSKLLGNLELIAVYQKRIH